MRVFIAEKPSLARAIATGLPVKGQNDDGYIECGNDIVTWCFGHLLELCYPEEYKPEYKMWRAEHLPIIPEEWKYKARTQAAKQLKVIGKLLKKADSVVNAGDPDREGQLLVDEVLEHFSYKGTVERIWLASLDDKSVAKALASLSDNKKHAPLCDSAKARSYADWLVGLNATRAMTIMGRKSGYGEVLSVGRVQTPTLALVVQRDTDIKNFTPIDYFTLKAELEHTAGHFSATFVPAENQEGLDADGRLVNKKIATSIAKAVKGKKGSITAVHTEKKQQQPPLPHCLSSLQKSASAKLNMSAKDVLDTAQSLYEKKLTTYPRSDCRYLPEEQFDAAKDILAKLANIESVAQVAGKATPTLQSAVWNTKKVTAHHAIIPTGEIPQGLSKTETALYAMIAHAYCLQFYVPFQYESQKITLTIEDYVWEAKGRNILERGWTSATQDDDNTADGEALPSVAQDDNVLCLDADCQAKKTTPPSRFTEGTLIEAMANIHRFVQDGEAKSVLKENEGIGTEATRAGILETLKSRGFVKAQKKALVATDLGHQVISMCPHALKDPITTAQWESKLSAIAQGELTFTAFMQEQKTFLPNLIKSILSATVKAAHPCPKCGQALIRRKNKKGEFFWGCSVYPTCKQTYPDKNSKPDMGAKK